MQVSPKQFFNFCATHVPLLRALTVRHREVTEAEVREQVRAHADTDAEAPARTWQKLLDLRILVPTEEGSSYYTITSSLQGLFNYLYNEAVPTSAEIIQGYISALSSAQRRMTDAILTDDQLKVGLANEEVEQTLRRILEDLEATQRAVLMEVGKYKADRSSVSIRERYLRIVDLMERYVDPLVDVVRVDGPLSDSLDEIDHALRSAREKGIYMDIGPLARSERQIRILRRRSVHTLHESRKELQPLYDTLRRQSAIAHGAAIALQQLPQLKLEVWMEVFGVSAGRCGVECPPTDAMIKQVIRNVIEHPPQPAPAISLIEPTETPPDLIRLRWLNGLLDSVDAVSPLPDVTEWLVTSFPDKGTTDTLLGLNRILFAPNQIVRFGTTMNTYTTEDGVLELTDISIERQ